MRSIVVLIMSLALLSVCSAASTGPRLFKRCFSKMLRDETELEALKEMPVDDSHPGDIYDFFEIPEKTKHSVPAHRMYGTKHGRVPKVSLKAMGRGANRRSIMIPQK